MLIALSRRTAVCQSFQTWCDTLASCEPQKVVQICCINWFTSLCKKLFNLLEFLAEAFRCHVHHFRCLTVPVELAVMFQFVVVGMAEMLLWVLWLLSQRVYGICNVFDRLICWLGIVYSLCYPNNHEPEHRSQFYQDRQALKMIHMASKSFC